MDKIIYKNITIDDNMMLIVQALIDKQNEIIDNVNTFYNIMDNLDKCIKIIAIKLRESNDGENR